MVKKTKCKLKTIRNLNLSKNKLRERDEEGVDRLKGIKNQLKKLKRLKKNLKYIKIKQKNLWRKNNSHHLLKSRKETNLQSRLKSLYWKERLQLTFFVHKEINYMFYKKMGTFIIVHWTRQIWEIIITNFI